MNVYISVDIEGVASITHWDEATKRKPGYAEYLEQMTAEAATAREGALNAGATEKIVKDAHGSGPNILPERLPKGTRLIRGWSGDPQCMVEFIDGSFDAVAMVGYHAAAGAGGNPLAHTITGKVAKMLINGQVTSEFMLHRDCAALQGVPTVFPSRDKTLCDSATATNPAPHMVATKESAGGSTTSLHPAVATTMIRDGIVTTLGDAATKKVLPLADSFEVELWYTDHEWAFKASTYPGARLHDPHAITYRTGQFFDIIRILIFVLEPVVFTKEIS